MKKVLYVAAAFAFCVAIPALSENYRVNSAHPQISDATHQAIVVLSER